MKNKILISPRFITIITLLVIGGILFLGRQSYETTERAAFNEFNQRQLLLASSVAHEIQNYFNTLAVHLQEVVDIPQVQNLSEKFIREKLRHELDQLRPMKVENILFLDAKGVIRHDGLDSDFVGQEFFNQKYFYRVKREGFGKDNYVVEILEVKQKEGVKKKVVIGIPFLSQKKAEGGLNQQKFLGSIVYIISLESIVEKFIAPVKASGRGHAFLIDENHHVLWSPDKNLLGKSYFQKVKGFADFQKIILNLNEGVSGTAEYFYYQFDEKLEKFTTKLEEKLIAYFPVTVNKLRWGLGVWAPKAEVRAKIQKVHFNQLVFVILIVGIILFGLFYILMIFSRIRRMLENEVEVKTQELEASQLRLRTVLDSIDAIVFVVDITTNEVLFANQYVKKTFGDSAGTHCWKYLQCGRHGTLCTKENLLAADGKPEGVGIWELHHSINGRWYEVHDRAIQWVDGRLVRLEVALDITERKVAEETMRHNEEKFRTLVKNIPGVVYRCAFDEHWTMIFMSEAIEEISGYLANDFIGNKVRTFSSIIHPEDQERNRDVIRQSIKKRKPFILEYRIFHKNSQIRWVYEKGQGVFNDEGGVLWLDGAIFDITDRRQSEDELRKLSQAVEQSPASVVISDVNGYIEYVNSKFEKVSGYTFGEVIGRKTNILKSGYTSDQMYQELWDTILAGNEWRGEIQNRKKNGELFWENVCISPIKGADNVITHFLASKEDITMNKEYERRLHHKAHFDYLTELPNRMLVFDRLTQAISSATRKDKEVVVMFIDLDQFKIVNDTLGNAAGDQLLIEAAGRLTDAIRKSDTVARLSGDEFLVILQDLIAATHSAVVAQKVLEAFSKPFFIDGREVFVTASIGLTVFPSDGKDPDALLRNADAAMYRAKKESRNTFRFFTPEMDERAVERMELETHLRYALDIGALELYYQPLIEMKTGKIVGAEALMRWNDPEFGLILPDRFIPLAEETGLIIKMEAWALKTACIQAKEWQVKEGFSLRILVNISSRQFKGTNLGMIIDKVLEESGLSSDFLELEITERLLIENEEKIKGTLSQLRAKGVRFSIDDFGTGYSALSYLKNFSFDTLKIDRSFVRDVTVDPEAALLTKAILSMAQSLGLMVIGEGVETPEQLAFLREHKCDWVQGFYFAKPLPAAEFLKFVHNYSPEKIK